MLRILPAATPSRDPVRHGDKQSLADRARLMIDAIGLALAVAQHEGEPIFIGMLQAEANIAAERLPQIFDGIAAFGVDFLQSGAEFAKRGVAQLIEHFFLALEIDIERGLRNADAGGDLPGRDILDAMFEKQLTRRAQNFFRPLVAAAARLPVFERNHIGSRRNLLDGRLSHLRLLMSAPRFIIFCGARVSPTHFHKQDRINARCARSNQGACADLRVHDVDMGFSTYSGEAPSGASRTLPLQQTRNCLSHVEPLADGRGVLDRAIAVILWAEAAGRVADVGRSALGQERSRRGEQRSGVLRLQCARRGLDAVKNRLSVSVHDAKRQSKTGSPGQKKFTHRLFLFFFSGRYFMSIDHCSKNR